MMQFLVEQLEEQKELEAEVSVDQFIKDNNISESAIIYKLIMSKEVYKDEKEAREYLEDKCVHNFEITQDESNFIVDIIGQSQMDMDTDVNVTLRRGIIAYAADLLPMQNMYEVGAFNFSEKGEMKSGIDLIDIKLSEGLPFIIEIARVAEGDHPTYGKLKITQEHLESMVNNFKSKVTGVDLAVNEDHKKNEAFGWFKDIFLSHDKQTLYGQINWNTKGVQALSEKAYRYFSPEFRFNYVHPHTGKEHGAALLGGALTNYPFLKMGAITELSSKEQTKTGVKKMPTIDLSEHNKIVVELNAKVTETSAQLDAAKSREIELSDKVKSLEAEAEKKVKEAAHKNLFDQGKINAAQLVALNEGKSMLEIIALNEPMHTTSVGTTGVKKETIELSADDKSIAAKLGLTDEQFVAGNKI